MDKVKLIAAITFRECLRNKALHGILLVSAFFSGVYLAVAPMFAYEGGKVAVDFGFASMSIAGISIVLFLGIPMLTRDLHQRTICMILSRPISRKQYLWGKLSGLILVVIVAALVIALFSVLSGGIAISFLEGVERPRGFSWSALTAAILLQVISIIILMALSFLVTIVTTSGYLAMLVTLGVYMIGQSLETIVKILTKKQYLQAGEFHIKLLEFLTWIFPNLRAFDIKVHVAYGLPLKSADVLVTAGYGFFYILITMFCTTLIFSTQEIG